MLPNFNRHMEEGESNIMFQTLMTICFNVTDDERKV